MSNTSAGLVAAVAVAASSLLAAAPSATPSSHPAATTEAGRTSGAPTADGGSPPGGVTFVDAALPALAARVHNMDSRVTIPVFVRNSTGADAEVSLAAALRSSSGAAINPIAVTAQAGGQPESSPARCDATPTCLVPKNSPAFLLTLTVTLPKTALENYPLNGWLSLNQKLAATAPGHAPPVCTHSSANPAAAPGRASAARATCHSCPSSSAIPPAAKVLEIKAIAGPATGADWTLLKRAALAALLAVALAGLIALVREGPTVLVNRMGSPSWSFDASWSSTLTIGGAILTPLLLFAGLPNQGHTFSNQSYRILGLLMAALIALAPGVYSLFRKPVQTKGTDAMSGIQYQGFVCLFLLAALITLTAVLAQLGLLAALFGDIEVAGILSPPAAALFRTLAVALQVVLWLYGVVSMVQTVHSQSAKKAAAEGKAQPRGLLRTGMSLNADAASGMQHPLPDWRLL